MEDNNKKKSTWKSWVFGVVLGIGLVILGSTGVIKDETVNNTLIQVGASQTAAGAVELNPDLAPAFKKAAYAIESAVAARKTQPEALVALIEAEVGEYTKADIKPVVEAVVVHINQAYATSDTEEKYHVKLLRLADGFMRGADIERDDALDE